MSADITLTESERAAILSARKVREDKLLAAENAEAARQSAVEKILKSSHKEIANMSPEDRNAAFLAAQAIIAAGDQV
jgi:hypothetical protein